MFTIYGVLRTPLRGVRSDFLPISWGPFGPPIEQNGGVFFGVSSREKKHWQWRCRCGMEGGEDDDHDVGGVGVVVVAAGVLCVRIIVFSKKQNKNGAI